MNLPTLRQLQYLVSVMELKHFGQAAERCFVTQSTLSSGIRELETLLGVKLLERDKRGVLPTERGERIAAKAREILGLSEQLVELARYRDAPLSGPLRLGLIPTIGPFLLPRVLPLLRERFADLALRLVEDQSGRLLERLNNGELEAAVIAFPYNIGDLESRLFWEENFQVALPQGHPLADAPQLSTQNLPADELLLLEEGHCLTDHAMSACHLQGLQARAAFQGTSLYTLVQMVAGGQGLTFLPDMAVRGDWLQAGDIRLIPLSEPGPHRHIGLIWRKSFARKDDLRLLTETMREAMATTEL